jgi:hypothetical protein
MEETLIQRTHELLTKLDLDGKRKAIREIEALSSHPIFGRIARPPPKR